MKSLITITSLSTLLISTAQAASIAWTGGGADDLWSNTANWDLARVPGTGDEITIGNGFTVDFDLNGNLPGGGATLNVDGVLNATTTLRTNGATINVSSTGELLGDSVNRFFDLNNATVNFADGAKFNQGVWESKGTNAFNFELGAAGFATMNPSRFQIGNSDTMANASYSVDMANYTGGIGVITLVDYGVDNEAGGIDNTKFQTASLSILNSGDYTANLQWNDATEAIELNITAVVPEPSSSALLGLGVCSLIIRRRR